jgi:hypothetical protein
MELILFYFMECRSLQKPSEQVDLFQSGLNLQLELSLKYSFTGLLNLYRGRRHIYSKSYFGNKEVLADTLIVVVPHFVLS